MCSLPSRAVRVLISLVVLFHFGGILAAVSSVPPRPWLSQVAWTYIYRPYLEALYLNNAYHFYAPEPGPATLLWFYVKYEDGTGRWYEVPRRDAHQMSLQYYRRLSLTESVNQLTPPLTSVPAKTLYRRVRKGAEDGIPLHPELVDVLQYRIPTVFSQRMLETYARRIARSTPHPSNPEIKVTSVKVYRVIHGILTPKELADGLTPDEETLYYPYFQGEFGPEGKLKDANDPYLYWMIPITASNDCVRTHAKCK